jgi:hypothetical protein
MANAVNNRGRQINFLTGITGVAAGGQAVINMPVNLRLHRLKLNCSGIYYSAPVITGTNPTNPLAAGAITATVVNGVITGFTIVTSALTTANGTYNMTITDPTGVGASGTFTVASNVITSTSLTSGGTVGPVPPAVFLNSIQHSVNGVLMRDIAPADVLSIATSQSRDSGSYLPRPGELPVYFTEPWRNINQNNEITSWDLFGQATYQIKFGISTAMTSPGLVGTYEFDFQRNLRPVTSQGKTTMQPFLQVVRQHSFNVVVPAGRFDINYLPIDYPITRMWLGETGPGSIQQVELYQDKNKILEATNEQITENYGDYGIEVGLANSTYTTTLAANALTGQPAGTFTSPRNFFDAAYVADPDQRIGKALQIANEMILRVYSASPTTLKVVMESLPGSYQ